LLVANETILVKKITKFEYIEPMSLVNEFKKNV